MGDGEEWQKLLAAREVRFQKNSTASGRGRSSERYGHLGILKGNTVLGSSTQKPTEAPPASVSVVNSSPVMMDDVCLKTLDPLPDPMIEEGYL